MHLLKGFFSFAWETKYANRSVWMCYSCEISKVLQINCSASGFWHLLPIPLMLPRCFFLEAHAITCFWWLSSTPVPPWISWLETQFHLIHFWFSFFFFLSLCSTPLLPFSLCCVLISPTPLLCHQLAPLVSKSWSHCACVALFLFLITNMYAWTVVAFHKHIHWTNTGHAYLHCYYQPLTSPQFFVETVDLPPHFFQNGGPDTIWLICLSSNLNW